MTTTERKNYGVNEIAELFPSLMKIKDQSLREKVAAVWSEAITTGCGGKGWTFDELRAVKFTLLAGDIDMTFVEHLNSCALQCIAIADVLESSFRCGIPVQRDILLAGALLADVGKPLEFDKDASGKVIQGTFGQQVRHPFTGVALAYKHGIPGEVMHMIATHSHEGDKMERSIESIIFHHADFVEDFFDRDALLHATVEVLDEAHVDLAGQEGERDRADLVERPALAAAAGGERFVPHGGDLVAQGGVADRHEVGEELGDVLGGVFHNRGMAVPAMHLPL